MSKKQKSYLRKKIIGISSLSLAISTVINPLLCGIFCALFLTISEFQILFWVIAIGKSILILKSLYDNRYTSFVDSSGVYPWLCVIYITFIGTVLYILNKSHNWSMEKLSKGGVTELFDSLGDLFFGEFIIKFLITAMIGATISYFMTSEDLIPEPTEEYNEL